MFSLNGTHGSIYIESKIFTDGQPHISIPHIREVPFHTVISGRITNPTDLLSLQLIVDVLRFNNRGDNMSLRLSYLMGGRMDREAGPFEPSTLRVICDTINSLGFKSVDLFDCHSVVSKTLLRARNHLPIEIVENIVSRKDSPVLVIPDAGAQHRVDAINTNNYPTVQCLKTRDPQTQMLSNFKCCNPAVVEGANCVIVDDICDGGRTFVNLAKVLRSHGAKTVDLFVSHGIFSYGYNLEGIDEINTTNSFRDMSLYPILYPNNHSDNSRFLKVFSAPFTPIPEPTDPKNLLN